MAAAKKQLKGIIVHVLDYEGAQVDEAEGKFCTTLEEAEAFASKALNDSGAAEDLSQYELSQLVHLFGVHDNGSIECCGTVSVAKTQVTVKTNLNTRFKL